MRLSGTRRNFAKKPVECCVFKIPGIVGVCRPRCGAASHQEPSSCLDTFEYSLFYWFLLINTHSHTQVFVFKMSVRCCQKCGLRFDEENNPIGAALGVPCEPGHHGPFQGNPTV
jgi:hypothetical protein